MVESFLSKARPVFKGERFVNGFGCCSEISEALSQKCELLPDLPEFTFRRRSHERFKLAEPMGCCVIEILLAQDAMSAIFSDWICLVWIRQLLRELARRFPKRDPGISAGSRQHPFGKCCLPQPFCFLALAAAFCPCIEHGSHGLHRKRRFHLLEVPGQCLNPTRA